jgi:Caspase domain/WD domain, G-beta repeat
VDAGERFLVSASDDKTARVWDLASGKLLQVLRPPEGEGFEGQIYAVAISPDGATVAVGGFTGETGRSKPVYLFDRATGRLARELGGFPELITHLSYSREGSYLVVALSGANGIRVLRTSDYQQVASDTAYANNCYWAEFDRAGRLVTVSYDGFVRLYSSDFRLVSKKHEPGGSQPFSARFSPDGTKIAVGFGDSTSVNVLSGKNLSFLYAPDTTQAKNGDLNSVAWSLDGKTLYAGGRYVDADYRAPIFSWSGKGRVGPTAWPVSGDTIMDIRALTGTRIAVATLDPVIGVLDAKGHSIWEQTPTILGYLGGRAFLVSGDGNVARFDGWSLQSEGTWNGREFRFSVADRQLAVNPAKDTSLRPPRTDGLNISDWQNSFAPKLNGQPLPVGQSEMSRSLAISSSADKFLLGTERYLQLFDSQGKPIWAVDAPGIARAVNLTADGRYAVAAFGDGTVRWYRTDDAKEVLGLFVDADGQRWVVWTPEGFFDSSKGGEALVGYHLNHGPNHEGEFIKVDQVMQLFYRPDLIAQALKSGGTQLIAAERQRVGDIATILSAGSPPDLTLLSPAQADSNGEYVLRFRVSDRGTGTGQTVYRIDGVEMEGRPVDIPTPGLDTVSRKFDLSPGQHHITATVYDRSNKLESRSITAIVDVNTAQQAPALFVVAVGVSNYRDHALDQGVKFAAQDAQLVAARLKQQGGGLFRDVITYPLSNEMATRLNIEKTIKDVAARIQANDEFILYLAGHGAALDGQYTFVPWEVRYTSADSLKQQSLGEEEIQRLLKMIPAKKTLLVLDTCDAGAAISGRDPTVSGKGSIDRLSKITGRAILAASSSDQMALEGYQNHGVFTYAFLEGLTKAADDQGFIQVSRLADYLEDRVPEITKQRWGYEQFPMSELAGQTFPVARKQ